MLLATGGILALLLRKDWLLPALLVFGALAYVAILSFYPDGRYLYPAIPLWALSTGAGYAALSGKMPVARLFLPTRLVPVVIGLATIVGCTGTAGQRAGDPTRQTVEQLAREGFAALNTSDLVTAKDRFQASMQLSNTFAPTHFGLASIAFHQGDTEEALRQVATAIELVPYYAEAYFLQATIQGQTSHAVAKQVLRTGLGYRPDYAPAMYLLGFLEIRDENYLDASHWFLEYIAHNRAAVDWVIDFCEGASHSMQPCSSALVTRLQSAANSANVLHYGRMSADIWQYLNKNTMEFGTQVWMPLDRNIGTYLGVCFEELGDTKAALQYFEWQLALTSGNDELEKHTQELRQKLSGGKN